MKYYTKTEIRKMLLKMGFTPKLMGFEPIVRSIEKILTDKKYLNAITSRLYPELAEEFGTTKVRIERNIRHSIEAAFDRNYEELEKKLILCTDSSRGKYTNGEFLSLMATIIEMEGM